MFFEIKKQKGITYLICTDDQKGLLKNRECWINFHPGPKKKFLYEKGKEVEIKPPEPQDSTLLSVSVIECPLLPEEFWPDRTLVLVFEIRDNEVRLSRRILWHKKNSTFDRIVDVEDVEWE